MTKTETRILVVEDNPADFYLIEDSLKRGGLEFQARCVMSRDAFVSELKVFEPHLILSDHNVPAFSGHDALGLARNHAPQIPFFFVSGLDSPDVPINLLPSRGAQGFIPKSRLASLVPSIKRLSRENAACRSRLQPETVQEDSIEAFDKTPLAGIYAEYLLDAEGKVLTWSSEAEFIEGYRCEEIIGQPFEVFFSREQRSVADPFNILSHAAMHGSHCLEGWYMGRGEESFAGELKVSALKSNEDELIGFVKRVCRFTPPSRASVRKIVGARARALSSSLLSQQQSIAHDLRTPLRHINQFATLLNETYGKGRSLGDSTERRYLDLISGSARKMDRLLNDYWTFSRLDYVETYPEKVPLEAFVEELMAGFLLERNANAASTPPIHWASKGLPVVYFDPLMAWFVLRVLLSNAIKFSGTRNEARLEIEAFESPDHHLIAVRDHGVGFEMRYSPRVFQLFHSLHDRHQYPGEGVGLANARRMVELHGGRFWVNAAPERGATFYFSVPKVDAF
jgi:nitrogen fixation/metabolism regulation signal transduction histidine kinase